MQGSSGQKEKQQKKHHCDKDSCVKDALKKHFLTDCHNLPS